MSRPIDYHKNKALVRLWHSLELPLQYRYPNGPMSRYADLGANAIGMFNYWNQFKSGILIRRKPQPPQE